MRERRCGGGEVDDHTATAIQQRREGLAGHQEGAREVDGQGGVPVVQGVLVGARGALDRGRIDKHFKPAEVGQRRIDRSDYGFFRRNVENLSAESLARVGVAGGGLGALQAVRGDVVADDGGTLAEEPQYGRLADAGAGPGDDDAPIGETLHCAIFFDHASWKALIGASSG